LRIGINAVLHRHCPGGVGKAIAGIVQGLAASDSGLPFEFFLSDSLRLDQLNSGKESHITVHHVHYRSRSKRILKEQFLALRHRHLDIQHHLGYVMPFFLPRHPVVVNIYDIIALTHPHLCTRSNRVFYHVMLPRSIKRANRIVVPSHYVRQRIEERYPSAGVKLRVLPLPLPKEIASARENVPPISSQLGNGDRAGRYLLFVGDLGPKKNLAFLLRSYALLPAEIREEYALRIYGRSAGNTESYRTLSVSLGIEKQVRFMGYVPDEDLPDVYRNAALLLYPSLEEGYGYPPLEAMALGTPAIVSDQGALPEIAGAAGAVVSPLEMGTFKEAIVGLLSDASLYREMCRRGQAGVLRETWVDYAHRLEGIYEELL
jgi:glycosyltransferase involved in cell wall biosynthesis